MFNLIDDEFEFLKNGLGFFIKFYYFNKIDILVFFEKIYYIMKKKLMDENFVMYLKIEIVYLV